MTKQQQNDARTIIEHIANADSSDTVGELSCDIKVHPDYPSSWIRDAARQWIERENKRAAR